MQISEILQTLDSFAPLRLAESWDNVGLLIGDPAEQLKNVMLTIDLTDAVFAEALQAKTDMIIAYHPYIWQPLKTIVAGQPDSPLAYELIKNNIAVYSPHTALDVAKGGVNDALAELLNITDPKPLNPIQQQTHKTCKVVVFLPPADIEPVSEAMFAAGAGQIGAAGKYSKCSFQTPGTGTFQCGPASSPAIGKPGSFEKVQELRLETIVAMKDLPAVLAAMLKAHSYEEPAYDIYPILNDPVAAANVELGLGRFGQLAKPQSAAELIDHIKTKLKLKTVGIIGSTRRKVNRAAVGAGSCGSMLQQVIDNNCDFYLTGELTHHNALKLQRAGVTTVCLSHSNSERLMLPLLAKLLSQKHPTLKTTISKKDKDPFTWQ